MSEKIAKLGIERDNDLMYYIKNGDVWATPRKQPGKPKGKPQKIAATGIDLDYSKYLYFVDGDGDVARKARANGGGGRKTKAKTNGSGKRKGNGETKVVRSGITGHFVTKATAKRHPKETVTETVHRGEKSPAQLQREIDECLSRSKNGGSGNGIKNGNGAKRAGKPGKKKRR